MSAKNVEAILTIQKICNVLVVLFFGNDLYLIGKVKIENEKQATLVNGVTFKFTLAKLIKECTNAQLLHYLKKFQSKNFDFTLEEKTEFVQLCCQIKHFPNLFIKSKPIPTLYQNDENEIIKIESPIVKMIPQLL